MLQRGQDLRTIVVRFRRIDLLDVGGQMAEIRVIVAKEELVSEPVMDLNVLGMNWMLSEPAWSAGDYTILVDGRLEDLAAHHKPKWYPATAKTMPPSRSGK